MQDSQRFVPLTLSNSDISLTTPRTGKHMHSLMRAETLSVFLTHAHARALLLSAFLILLCAAAHKHVSNGIQSQLTR